MEVGLEKVSAEELWAIEQAMAQVEGQSLSLQTPSPTPSLPDYLDYGLDIVFVGDNPGLTSARNKRWYAHASNHFWPLLHDSGFLPTPLSPDQDHLVTQYKVGLTCLCSRPTRGTDELKREELQEGLRLLKVKLEQYRPRAICFNGVGIYESVTGIKPRVGYQGDRTIVPGIAVFVMPSSSMRVKSYTYEMKLSILREAKERVDAMLADQAKP